MNVMAFFQRLLAFPRQLPAPDLALIGVIGETNEIHS
jgi:hypothetical protein